MIPKNIFGKSPHLRLQAPVSASLVQAAAMDVAAVYERFASGPEGLSTEQAQVGLETHGSNVLAKDQRPGIATLLVHAVLNPIVILLVVLSSVSAATGDYRAASMMVVMILIGVGLKLFQEAKADNAAAKLKAMISVTATVLRDGKPQETRVSQLVPGDVVVLAAGDMIPADVRLLAAKDLFVTQSSLTGESFPVEKFAIERNPNATLPMELTSIAFLGTSVESGSAQGIVVATGTSTYLGDVSASLSEQEPPTSFDRGINQFTWLLVRFVLVMVPLVFLINGFTKGNWGEAFFFAIAVAVGLTPKCCP